MDVKVVARGEGSVKRDGERFVPVVGLIFILYEVDVAEWRGRKHIQRCALVHKMESTSASYPPPRSSCSPAKLCFLDICGYAQMERSSGP